ncbi:unnamed protein product [Pseudo-nitzschia multistriata]|uniref:Ketoreductase (KR) domain-containing protein n=1 Tax=Pseudo-nitzschia multistriata TaxID=183589 RepID=A0A448Z5K5_9STRA|nr:unnamed protein product [Pseudo-nitzschia multistriata]
MDPVVDGEGSLSVSLHFDPQKIPTVQPGKTASRHSHHQRRIAPHRTSSHTTPQHNTVHPLERTMLTNKLALITGGGGSIGKAIAGAFLARNISVVLAGRRLSKLEEARADLLEKQAEKGGPQGTAATVHAISCDVSSEDSVVRLFRQIDELGSGGGPGVDILVNNAGINATAGSVEELTAGDMEAVLGVNVVGAFLCAREAIKRMKQKKGSGTGTGNGRIVNIGSISSFSPRPNSTAYTTSKFAIAGLSKSLALDVRDHGIAVGTIHPGNVVSELLSPEDVEVRGRTEGFLRPEDVAGCVLTMVELPPSANVLEMTVMPTTQPLVGRG